MQNELSRPCGGAHGQEQRDRDAGPLGEVHQILHSDLVGLDWACDVENSEISQ